MEDRVAPACKAGNMLIQHIARAINRALLPIRARTITANARHICMGLTVTKQKDSTIGTLN